MRKNIIDENFVDELCKSGVWDLMSPEKGCNITEAFGDSPGDVPAQRKATHARITGIRKRGGMTPEGERTMRQRVTSGRTDPRRTSTGRSGRSAGMGTPRHDILPEDSSTQVEDTDEVSARELAEELFENLSDDVVYECIDILHSTLLNEEDSLDEETLTEEESYQLLEDALQEMDEEELDSLLNEAIAALDEEYDLSEATEEDLNEAVMDYILERHGRRGRGPGQRGRMGHVHTDDEQPQEAPPREIGDKAFWLTPRRGGKKWERDEAEELAKTKSGRRKHARTAGRDEPDDAPYVRAKIARKKSIEDRRTGDVVAKQQAAQAEVRAEKRKKDPRKRDYSKPSLKPRSTATTDPAPTKRQTPEEFLKAHNLWQSPKSKSSEK